MASLLRPGGSVFIIDCFLEDPKYAELFNSHWHTRIGTLDEYFAAARDTGLKTGSVVDVTDRTVHFWTTTLALIDADPLAPKAPSLTAMPRRPKLIGSCGTAFRTAGFATQCVAFTKSAERARAQPALATAEAS